MTLFGLIWRGTILFVVLTIIYVIMTVSGRIKEGQRLHKEFETAKTDLSEDDYVEIGMKKYNQSLKAKLLLGVYLVPILLFSLLVYLAQL